jgi:uncharacterized protein
MQLKIRELHRDFGYFFIGLIISFSISGILQNHRQTWHPEKYTVEVKPITVQLPKDEKEITEDFAKNLSFGFKDKFRRHSIKKGELKISYEKHDVEIDIKSGKGEIITFRKTPFIAQMNQLHKDTSVWWIYYSDLFAVGLIFIAVTGAMMFPRGKFSFKSRGWKLAVLGIVFPLIFLFLIA